MKNLISKWVATAATVAVVAFAPTASAETT